MKKATFFSLFFFGWFGWGLAQQANVYRLEKLYQPEATIGDYVAWQGESVLIPIRYDSKEITLVDISFSGIDAEVEYFQLFEVWADFSAGFCGQSKANGTFEKIQIPDRAMKLNDAKFVPDTPEQWILTKVDLPDHISPGSYRYSLVFEQKGKKSALAGKIQVVDRRLGKASTSDFYMDFWQFPMAVADYYKLKPWSEAHWSQVGIQFDQLAAINQHSITASVFWDLYNTKIRPAEEMMIQVKRSANGSYVYDYSIFDRYVSLGMEKGITGQIAIHNLFPWNTFFFYLDESTKQMVSTPALPGTSEYRQYWEPLLRNLGDHLRQKGWLHKSIFFVDERDPTQTAELIRWVQSLDPAFQFGFSGDFYPALSPLVRDYSTPMNVVIDPIELSQRILQAGTTSLYTSCFEKPNQPNMLMPSDLREIYFLVQLAQSKGDDGMLRWAFNLWYSEINDSAIYSDLPSGDAHFVYPDGQVSVRYLVLQDAFEEVAKSKAVTKTKGLSDMVVAMNRYFLINIEKDRYQMVEALKNYLND